ncbi:bone morphogenetic protein receptor type-2-like [Scomber scombrus]|uniref:bone morphogenetic protein receptor type-2-like n=1 Tax=Scomber scombrus TaxID=13677 RepID=UPI002DD9763C|nr:bone morphogenetic protein receptor type-2-like [Scomber scombrus]
MILQLWRLILTLECILLLISNQSSIEKRKCAFQLNPLNPHNDVYRYVGDVSGSVQLCEKTRCCVGYFMVNNSQPKVDVLACDIVEKICPDATCRPQTRFNNRFIKCVCNTDLCNSNMTWTPEPKELPPASVALEASQQASPDDSHVSPLCSCLTSKAAEIDIADVELQQTVAHGHFATVWQGKYKGSVVAVKVIPTSSKCHFITEKEVYELPLLKHAGIAHFLGTARKPDGDSWLTVLEFAEHGSLHSFLCKHTTSWIVSLKLCQSLSQGLSYLHSDLHSNDVHKPPVAHRDLSSFNVLVRADGTCALSDFGCSTILRSCSGPRQQQSYIRNTVAHAQVGTLCYMSPEILEGFVNLHSGWCLQGDIYALGLLLWEIWMRCSDLFKGRIAPQHLMPYESELGASMTLENLTWYVFYLEKRPSIPDNWKLLPQGSVLLELLSECWDSDPDARLTAPCVADRLVSLQSCHSL